MAVEFDCPNCGQRLRVADQHIGKQAKCPACSTSAEVPPQSSPPGGSSLGGSSLGGSPQGGGFGSFGSSNAGNTPGVPPRLSSGGDFTPAGYGQSPAIPPVDPNNPYAGTLQNPTWGGAPVGGMYSQPHRGGLILTFGILSLVTCVCGAFGVIGLGFSISAWIMASADLKAMASGVMDPSGIGTTQAGKILAIIHICLLGFFILAYAAIIIIAVATGEFQ